MDQKYKQLSSSVEKLRSPSFSRSISLLLRPKPFNNSPFEPHSAPTSSVPHLWRSPSVSSLSAISRLPSPPSLPASLAALTTPSRTRKYFSKKLSDSRLSFNTKTPRKLREKNYEVEDISVNSKGLQTRPKGIGPFEEDTGSSTSLWENAPHSRHMGACPSMTPLAAPSSPRPLRCFNASPRPWVTKKYSSASQVVCSTNKEPHIEESSSVATFIVGQTDHFTRIENNSFPVENITADVIRGLKDIIAKRKSRIASVSVSSDVFDFKTDKNDISLSDAKENGSIPNKRRLVSMERSLDFIDSESLKDTSEEDIRTLVTEFERTKSEEYVKSNVKDIFTDHISRKDQNNKSNTSGNPKLSDGPEINLLDETSNPQGNAVTLKLKDNPQSNVISNEYSESKKVQALRSTSEENATNYVSCISHSSYICPVTTITTTCSSICSARTTTTFTCSSPITSIDLLSDTIITSDRTSAHCFTSISVSCSLPTTTAVTPLHLPSATIFTSSLGHTEPNTTLAADQNKHALITTKIKKEKREKEASGDKQWKIKSARKTIKETLERKFHSSDDLSVPNLSYSIFRKSPLMSRSIGNKKEKNRSKISLLNSKRNSEGLLSCRKLSDDNIVLLTKSQFAKVKNSRWNSEERDTFIESHIYRKPGDALPEHCLSTSHPPHPPPSSCSATHLHEARANSVSCTCVKESTIHLSQPSTKPSLIKDKSKKSERVLGGNGDGDRPPPITSITEQNLLDGKGRAVRRKPDIPDNLAKRRRGHVPTLSASTSDSSETSVVPAGGSSPRVTVNHILASLNFARFRLGDFTSSLSGAKKEPRSSSPPVRPPRSRCDTEKSRKISGCTKQKTVSSDEVRKNSELIGWRRSRSATEGGRDLQIMSTSKHSLLTRTRSAPQSQKLIVKQQEFQNSAKDIDKFKKKLENSLTACPNDKIVRSINTANGSQESNVDGSAVLPSLSKESREVIRTTSVNKNKCLLPPLPNETRFGFRDIPFRTASVSQTELSADVLKGGRTSPGLRLYPVCKDYGKRNTLPRRKTEIYQATVDRNEVSVFTTSCADISTLDTHDTTLDSSKSKSETELVDQELRTETSISEQYVDTIPRVPDFQNRIDAVLTPDSDDFVVMDRKISSNDGVGEGVNAVSGDKKNKKVVFGLWPSAESDHSHISECVEGENNEIVALENVENMFLDESESIATGNSDKSNDDAEVLGAGAVISDNILTQSDIFRENDYSNMHDSVSIPLSIQSVCDDSTYVSISNVFETSATDFPVHSNPSPVYTQSRNLSVRPIEDSTQSHVFDANDKYNVTTNNSPLHCSSTSPIVSTARTQSCDSNLTQNQYQINMSPTPSSGLRSEVRRGSLPCESAFPHMTVKPNFDTTQNENARESIIQAVNKLMNRSKLPPSGASEYVLSQNEKNLQLRRGSSFDHYKNDTAHGGEGLSSDRKLFSINFPINENEALPNVESSIKETTTSDGNNLRSQFTNHKCLQRANGIDIINQEELENVESSTDTSKNDMCQPKRETSNDQEEPTPTENSISSPDTCESEIKVDSDYPLAPQLSDEGISVEEVRRRQHILTSDSSSQDSTGLENYRSDTGMFPSLTEAEIDAYEGREDDFSLLERVGSMLRRTNLSGSSLDHSLTYPPSNRVRGDMGYSSIDSSGVKSLASNGGPREDTSEVQSSSISLVDSIPSEGEESNIDTETRLLRGNDDVRVRDVEERKVKHYSDPCSERVSLTGHSMYSHTGDNIEPVQKCVVSQASTDSEGKDELSQELLEAQYGQYRGAQYFSSPQVLLTGYDHDPWQEKSSESSFNRNSRTASPSSYFEGESGDFIGGRSPYGPRRYSKRPLRGPYGEMLEAEMSKSKTNYLSEDMYLSARDSKSSSPCPLSASASVSPGLSPTISLNQDLRIPCRTMDDSSIRLFYTDTIHLGTTSPPSVTSCSSECDSELSALRPPLHQRTKSSPSKLFCEPGVTFDEQEHSAYYKAARRFISREGQEKFNEYSIGKIKSNPFSKAFRKNSLSFESKTDDDSIDRPNKNKESIDSEDSNTSKLTDERNLVDIHEISVENINQTENVKRSRLSQANKSKTSHMQHLIDDELHPSSLKHFQQKVKYEHSDEQQLQARQIFLLQQQQQQHQLMAKDDQLQGHRQQQQKQKQSQSQLGEKGEHRHGQNRRHKWVSII